MSTTGVSTPFPRRVPQSLLQVKRDRLNSAGEGELTFVFIGWVNWRDRIPPNLEWLQPVSKGRARELAFAGWHVVDEQLDGAAAFLRAVGGELRFQRDLSFRQFD